MAEVMNLDCFQGNRGVRFQLGALGYKVPDDVRNQPGPKNGGMTKMDRVHLSVGQDYYRFCDSTKFNKDWRAAAAGPWWMEFETFNIIREFARKHKHIRDFAHEHGKTGLSYSAKLHLAIPFEWGDCNAVVCARLTKRIDAWKGWGDIVRLSDPPAAGKKDYRDARDGGAKYIPLQKPECFQLYIPEIWNYFDDVFEVVKKGHSNWFA